MKNTLWLYGVICYVFCSSGCTSVPEQRRKPNVVFISVDDLRPELGCYGNSIVQTPNLDKLASEGTVFTNHFVQVPTCGASRYALMTGIRPRNYAQLSNNAFVTELADRPEGEIPESFIHQLKRNGYYTVGIGKISHSADGLVYGYEEEPSNKRELPYSWDELVFDSGKWGTGWNAFFGYAKGENRQSMKRQVRPYEQGEVDDMGYPDGLTTKLAISKLHELKKRKQAFFLGVGFFKPHLPFNAPQKYWDLYDRNQMPLAPDPLLPKKVNRASLHESGEFNGYRLSDEKASLSRPLSDAYAQKLTHAYYASVSYIDAQIGKVLNEIDKLDLEKNTIVVVWGDHGWHLGNKRVWGKHTLFETALKSVLIVKVPGVAVRGNQMGSIVETVDIYPSLLELCGVKLSHEIDGESFVELLKTENSKKADVAYSYFKKGVSLRTARYRLTKYYRNEEPLIELYDHNTDPYETENIALEKPEIVKKLLPLLEKGYTGMYDTEI